jgi:hypothetical protein
MRVLLALAIFIGGLSVWQPDANAARKKFRGAHGYHPVAPFRSYRRSRGVCEARARFFDPNGTFRGFPCWARSAFGQGRR